MLADQTGSREVGAHVETSGKKKQIRGEGWERLEEGGHVFFITIAVSKSGVDCANCREEVVARFLFKSLC